MQRITKVPTNIITGFLGSGKTTAINQLIKQKPEDEVWAILVNEFGQIGIDSALMANQDNLHIKELAGGCVCCTLGPSLTITLAMLLRRVKPHRLIIEPTGLGHPAGIVDVLTGISFEEAIDLRSIICVLDPAVLEHPGILANPIFTDQLNLADIVLINRCDLSPASLCQEAQHACENLFPPKESVLRTLFGVFPLSLLDNPRQSFESMEPYTRHADAKKELPQVASNTPQTSLAFSPQYSEPKPMPSKPIRKSHAQEGIYTYGWIFAAKDAFEFDSLKAELDRMTHLMRLKAAINIGHTWVSYNRVFQDASVLPLAWRKDSRFEIISESSLDPDEIEECLIKHIIPSQ